MDETAITKLSAAKPIYHNLLPSISRLVYVQKGSEEEEGQARMVTSTSSTTLAFSVVDETNIEELEKEENENV